MQETPREDDLSLADIDMREAGDGHIGVSMSALEFQHRLFLREMQGKLLPDQIPLADLEVVLDFLCGPGSWCIDFSKKYPEKRVYGVDIDHSIIEHAQENAAQMSSNHLEFRIADRRRPLPFADNMFDCLRLLNGTSFFTTEQWPDLLAELARVLKPGGWLNLVDFEMGPASHPAIDRVLTYLGRILARMGRGTAPGGQAPVTGATLGPRRMAQLHFTEIGYRFYPVSLGGWNNPMGRAYLAWSIVRPEMLLYLAEKTGVSTKAALQPLLREVQHELRQIDFCGWGMLVSSFGRKPREELS